MEMDDDHYNGCLQNVKRAQSSGEDYGIIMPVLKMMKH